jgi:predicted ATPase/DNA-binding CsgD family transcriptional regulator/Tfp pilus assembly protein PilF
MEAACRLLQDASVRLLTVTGPPGTGKTRLALHLAADHAGRFADGAVFVGLEALRDPAEVIPTIARTLSIAEKGGQTVDTLLDAALRDRHQLLVLDNAEQVLDAAPALAHLLSACPRIVLLVTSRTPLHLRGEYELALAPLAVPDSRATPDSLRRYAAVELFLERGQAVRRDFELTETNARTVAEIVTRLDGLPLALELAAARVKALTPETLLERLGRRLDLLTGGARDLPERHRTLRAAIAWSHDLLDDDERALFRRLSVFAGGWTLEAAEAVCGEEPRATSNQQPGEAASVSLPVARCPLLDLLSRLVDASLVVLDEQREGRYRFLETIREYAGEQLGESGEQAAFRARQAAYATYLGETAMPHLHGGADQAQWMARLEDEHDNLRAGLEWNLSSEGDPTAALRLCGRLSRFWSLRGYLREGRAWTERALAATPNGSARDRSVALNGAGVLAIQQGDMVAPRTWWTESLELLRDLGEAAGVGNLLNNLGTLAWQQGDIDEALVLFEESIEIFRGLDDTFRVATLLRNFGELSRGQGDHARARACYQESLALCRARNDDAGIARSLTGIGEAARDAGEIDESAAMFEEALTLQRGLGDQRGINQTLRNLGEVAMARGDHDEAHRRYTESLAFDQQISNTASVLTNLRALARVAIAVGAPVRAARLFGAAEQLGEALDIAQTQEDRTRDDRHALTIEEQIGAAALASAWAEGRGMTIEEAVVLALAPSSEYTATLPVPEPAPEPKPIQPPEQPKTALTARELEILRLVAEGLSNRVIAERLVLSEKTIHRHIANIFDKLDVTTRAAAAAFAFRAGIV